MPQKNAKVSLYNGSKTAFLKAINTDQIDPNGIYFIEGEERQIYVGDKLYGSGSSISNIEHAILHCYGTIISDTQYVCQLSSVKHSSQISVLVGGIYLNGLRAVNELDVSCAIDTIQEDGDTYYVPTITISSSNNYTDRFTEITIDIYVSESIKNSVSDTTIVELGLDTQN